MAPAARTHGSGHGHISVATIMTHGCAEMEYLQALLYMKWLMSDLCAQAIKWAESQEAANVELKHSKYGMVPGSNSPEYGSPSDSLLAAIH